MPSDVRFSQRSFLPRNAATSKKVSRGLVLTGIVAILFLLLRYSGLGQPRFEFAIVPVAIRPELYPAKTIIPLPRQRAKKLPKIQHEPVAESIQEKAVREGRLKEVRDAFLHAWKGYKDHAWAQDELRPLAGTFHSPFCGWAATMVDSLDTLWIMGLMGEFEMALKELENVDFTGKEGCRVNLFETTIRHLGGLLAAWDLSGGKYPILMEKAVELGEILFTAFDTPNRMPTPHYMWSA